MPFIYLSCLIALAGMPSSILKEMKVGMGWEGGSEGEDICIHIADSCCCTAETNTTL